MGDLHLAAGYGLLALVEAVDRTRGSTTRGRRSIEPDMHYNPIQSKFMWRAEQLRV